MDLYCVMGNPVEHSRSPRIHARFAELCGQQMDYGRRLIPLGAFAEGIAGFRRDAAERGDTARGCNITVPFKFEAAALAQHTSERATLAQAVNTLRFEADGSIHADNTDGIGLVNDIVCNAGVPLAGKALLLIGAGGAAAGVLGPLLDAGASRIVVANRTVDKAVAVVRRHAALALRHGAALEAWALDEVPGTFDVVLNATASSLAGDAVPVSAKVLRTGALAVDMMYGPTAAGFMAWAEAHGAVPRDGLGMLVEQAAESFEIWRGVRPPSAQVLAELRTSLACRHMKAVLRLVACLLVAGVALELFFVVRIAAMAVIDPQSTAFQRSEAWQIALHQGSQGGWRQEWVPYAQISDTLKRAVIASEDAGFVDHNGVEWEAIERARARNAKAEELAAKRAARAVARGRPVQPVRLRGGSTITQQLAKNLLLSGERTLLRKGQELVLATLLEVLLDKRRILEIYLNNVEWGEGVFGAEAASQYYFRKPASRLSANEAARLAVMLPSPKFFERRPGSPYLSGRASTVVARMPAAELP